MNKKSFYSKSFIIVIPFVLFFGIVLTFTPVYAVHTGITDRVFSIEATNPFAGIANIHLFDPATDSATIITRIPSGPLENGRAMAFDGTNLWYTILSSPQANGDGLIHKIGRSGGSDLLTIQDPFLGMGRGIGALDFDGGDLWAISYIESNHTETIFKINTAGGAILASCDIPSTSATDTLAVINGTLLTDGGEQLDNLTEYLTPIAIGGPCTATGKVFTLPVNVTGIDTDSAGNLIATDLKTIYNLGHPPYNTIVSSQPNIYNMEEDIATAPISPSKGCSISKDLQPADPIEMNSVVVRGFVKTIHTEKEVFICKSPPGVIDLNIYTEIIENVQTRTSPKISFIVVSCSKTFDGTVLQCVLQEPPKKLPFLNCSLQVPSVSFPIEMNTVVVNDIIPPTIVAKTIDAEKEVFKCDLGRDGRPTKIKDVIIFTELYENFGKLNPVTKNFVYANCIKNIFNATVIACNSQTIPTN